MSLLFFVFLGIFSLCPIITSGSSADSSFDEENLRFRSIVKKDPLELFSPDLIGRYGDNEAEVIGVLAMIIFKALKQNIPVPFDAPATTAFVDAPFESLDNAMWKPINMLLPSNYDMWERPPLGLQRIMNYPAEAVNINHIPRILPHTIFKFKGESTIRTVFDEYCPLELLAMLVGPAGATFSPPLRFIMQIVYHLLISEPERLRGRKIIQLAFIYQQFMDFENLDKGLRLSYKRKVAWKLAEIIRAKMILGDKQSKAVELIEIVDQIPNELSLNVPVGFQDPVVFSVLHANPFKYNYGSIERFIGRKVLEKNVVEKNVCHTFASFKDCLMQNESNYVYLDIINQLPSRHQWHVDSLNKYLTLHYDQVDISMLKIPFLRKLLLTAQYMAGDDSSRWNFKDASIDLKMTYAMDQKMVYWMLRWNWGPILFPSTTAIETDSKHRKISVRILTLDDQILSNLEDALEWMFVMKDVYDYKSGPDCHSYLPEGQESAGNLVYVPSIYDEFSLHNSVNVKNGIACLGFDPEHAVHLIINSNIELETTSLTQRPMTWHVEFHTKMRGYSSIMIFDCKWSLIHKDRVSSTSTEMAVNLPIRPYYIVIGEFSREQLSFRLQTFSGNNRLYWPAILEAYPKVYQFRFLPPIH